MRNGKVKIRIKCKWLLLDPWADEYEAETEGHFLNDGLLSITRRWGDGDACAITRRLFDDVLEDRKADREDCLKYSPRCSQQEQVHFFWLVSTRTN